MVTCYSGAEEATSFGAGMDIDVTGGEYLCAQSMPSRGSGGIYMLFQGNFDN